MCSAEMSTEFLDAFFPLTSYLVRTRHPQLFRRLFPSELQLKCSRPLHVLSIDGEGRYTLPIRWPALSLVILFGIVIGLYGYVKLQRKSCRPPTPSWALAMAFYALMNIAALGSHCLVSRFSSWQPSLVSLDIAGTACCAFSALYACISDELVGGVRAGAAAKAITSRKKHVMNLLVGNGLLNIASFFGIDIPFMAELLYIGTAVAAVIVVGSYMHRRAAIGRQRRCILLTFTGGAVALSGIPLDAHLCRHLGPHINHVILLFVGSHMAMLGIFLYVQEELVVRYDAVTAVGTTGAMSVTDGARPPATAGAEGLVSLGGDGASVRRRK